jgi:hypothetical protein
MVQKLKRTKKRTSRNIPEGAAAAATTAVVGSTAASCSSTLPSVLH